MGCASAVHMGEGVHRLAPLCCSVCSYQVPVSTLFSVSLYIFYKTNQIIHKVDGISGSILQLLTLCLTMSST